MVRRAHHDTLEFFSDSSLFTLFSLLLAALAGVDSLEDSAHADEDVDDPFDCRPCSEEHMDDVEVFADESADADETPVDSSNENEKTGDFADAARLTLIHHKEEGEGE